MILVVNLLIITFWGGIMDKVLGGISLITIIGGIGLILDLFLAKEPEIYFFTKRKKYLKNLLAYSVVIFLMFVSSYMFIKTDFVVSVKIISVLYNVVGFFILGSWLICQKKYKKLIWVSNKVQFIMSKDIVIGFFIVVFFLSAGVMEKEILNRSIEMNFTNNQYLAVSIFGGLMIAFSSTFLLRTVVIINDCFNRKVCWIEYIDIFDNATRYYIYYAVDKEFVVCGTEANSEDCKDYKYISISEIKKDMVVHIDKKSIN